MKKKIWTTAFALGLTSMLWAQQKKVPPPPPPPPAPVVDVAPPPPPPPPAPPKVPKSSDRALRNGKDDLPKDYRQFLQRNKTVRTLSWSGNGNIVNVYLKNGSKESYNVDKADELQKVENKYGKLPKAPPPPPMVISE